MSLRCPQLDSVHVLVVDDDADALEAIERILRSREARVTIASSAAACFICSIHGRLMYGRASTLGNKERIGSFAGSYWGSLLFRFVMNLHNAGPAHTDEVGFDGLISRMIRRGAH
jgi:hypothetical protein